MVRRGCPARTVVGMRPEVGEVADAASPGGRNRGPHVTEMIVDVVMPVLSGMTHGDEVDSVSVGWADGQLWLEAVLRGETFREPLWVPSDPPWSVGTARERLISDLQDFIAESKFGWGELRLPTRPDHADTG